MTTSDLSCLNRRSDIQQIKSLNIQLLLLLKTIIDLWIIHNTGSLLNAGDLKSNCNVLKVNLLEKRCFDSSSGGAFKGDGFRDAASRRGVLAC